LKETFSEKTGKQQISGARAKETYEPEQDVNDSAVNTDAPMEN